MVMHIKNIKQKYLSDVSYECNTYQKASNCNSSNGITTQCPTIEHILCKQQTKSIMDSAVQRAIKGNIDKATSVYSFLFIIKCQTISCVESKNSRITFMPPCVHKYESHCVFCARFQVLKFELCNAQYEFLLHTSVIQVTQDSV